MKVKEGDRVLLKSGLEGLVVEVLKEDVAFIVDVLVSSPNWEKEVYPEFDTLSVNIGDIEKVL